MSLPPAIAVTPGRAQQRDPGRRPDRRPGKHHDGSLVGEPVGREPGGDVHRDAHVRRRRTVALHADGSATPDHRLRRGDPHRPGGGVVGRCPGHPLPAIGTHTIRPWLVRGQQRPRPRPDANPAATATTVASSANPVGPVGPAGDVHATVTWPTAAGRWRSTPTAPPPLIPAAPAVALAEPPSLPFQATCTTSALVLLYTITLATPATAETVADNCNVGRAVQTVNKVATVITSTST